MLMKLSCGVLTTGKLLFPFYPHDRRFHCIIGLFSGRIMRKSEKRFIRPLTENLKRPFNLVQFGGLTVLPAESVSGFTIYSSKGLLSQTFLSFGRNLILTR